MCFIPVTFHFAMPLALACLGPIRDLWKCKARSEQGPWEYSNRSAHLDHSCQVGGGQWEHTDGGKDHWQSNHLTTGKWGGNQPWAVDSGQLQMKAFLSLCDCRWMLPHLSFFFFLTYFFIAFLCFVGIGYIHFQIVSQLLRDKSIMSVLFEESENVLCSGIVIPNRSANLP